MGLFDSIKTNREQKKREKEQNIAKWNEHIGRCIQKNRIAQIQHIDEYLKFDSSVAFNVLFAKIFYWRENDGEHIENKRQIVFYDNQEKPVNIPVDEDELARVLFKIVPFFIVNAVDAIDPKVGAMNGVEAFDVIDYDKCKFETYCPMDYVRIKWNHGSDYDCDDKYDGKKYVFTFQQDSYDSSIETENDVFIKKSEIKYLSNDVLFYLCYIIAEWENDNGLCNLVGDYNVWREKREFLLNYKFEINEELYKRGLYFKYFTEEIGNTRTILTKRGYSKNIENLDKSKHFDTDCDESDFEEEKEQDTNYGEQGEQNVEYSLKWLPKEYRKIEKGDGIYLRDTKVSDEKQEIDHIIIGPNGVFLVETKYFKGNITIDSYGNWSRELDDGKIEGMKNPIQQVDRHHMIVSSLLSGIVDEKDVHDIICLAYDACRINGIENSTVPVVKSDLLNRHILETPSEKTYTIDDIENIISAIENNRV